MSALFGDNDSLFDKFIDIDLGDDIDDVVLDSDDLSIEGELVFEPDYEFEKAPTIHGFSMEEDEIVFYKGSSWRRRLLICSLLIGVVTAVASVTAVVVANNKNQEEDQRIQGFQGGKGQMGGQQDNGYDGGQTTPVPPPSLAPTRRPEACNEEFSVRATNIFDACDNSPEAEEAHNALDDVSSTKFLIFTDRSCRDFSLTWTPLPTKFSLDEEPYTIQRYTITTASDAHKYPERNPHTWLLQGRESDSSKWLDFDAVDNAHALPSRGDVPISFFPQNSHSGKFKEFRILFSHEGPALQIADIVLDIYYPQVVCDGSDRDGPNLRVPTPSPSSPSENGGEQQESYSPTADSIPQWINWLSLQNPSLDMSVLLKPSSPQHRAIAWLATQSGVPSPGSENETRPKPDSWYTDRFALATLYFNTDGPHWRLYADSFLQDMISCSGSGIECSEDGDIVSLEFEWFLSSTGHIPTEIGMLKSLTSLDLSQTGFLNGVVPTEIGLLSTLETLNLSNSGEPSLSGSIPSQLGNLSGLRNLNLGSNEMIKGSIPSELFRLTDLETLILNDCAFTGSLPSDLGKLTRLRELNLNSNKFKGPLSDHHLESLSNLRVLSLAQNEFSGSIPSEIIQACTKLETFELAGNSIHGTIPSGLGNISNLKIVRFESNKLGGKFPSDLSDLKHLKRITMQDNELSGTIPVGLERSTGLEYLNLARNKMSGKIPSLASMRGMIELDLGNNFFTGTIPSEFGNFDSGNMKRLALQENQLDGSIPSTLGRLGGKITELLLGNNGLSYSIPSELGRLTSLTEFDISHNALTGSIPSTVGNLSDLMTLDMGTNRLDGKVPSELGRLIQLMIFRLDHNNLTGQLPSDLSNLTSFSSFISLDLRFNDFTDYRPAGWDETLCQNQFWCECI
jgi:Leucine-rich repeat (LRR) protein